jgi:hypothetical protein
VSASLPTNFSYLPLVDDDELKYLPAPMALLKFWPGKGLSSTDRLTRENSDSKPSEQPGHRWTQKTDSVDLEALRARLRKMTDAELRRFGQTVHRMCIHRADSPENAFALQMEECEAEWRRRHLPV